ncbi:UNVERIFIED_CONTAM: hypothetical protein Sangu_2541300 [Sesamum angustifolium]|uniref:Aminotransferase-like plant mobile domain-containing protein n=1 Tax=Sesamum angustifolium TaxID=2727405 RepID=A0AAW2J9C5_9LAMI
MGLAHPCWTPYGLLYDEFVPCAKELDGVNETGQKLVPRSCKFLLHAYHLLQGSNGANHFSQIPADKWIKFWFKKVTKYCEALPHKEKKVVCPKSTHNPFGTFGVHGKWSPAYEVVFSKLGIKGSVGSIHPNTFKVASIMVAGRKVGFATPILASICKCLNKACNMITKDKDFSFVYDGRAKVLVEAYLMAIFPNYLSLRQGDRFAIESYSPHRFSREFGFFQEVPGIVHKIFSRRLWKMEFIIDAYAFNLRLWKRYARLLGTSPIKVPPKDKECGKRVVQDLAYEHGAFVPPKYNSQVVEALETSKKKSVSCSLDENESSDLDRHWKRPKKDSNIAKPTNVDGDASSHAPSMLNFARELEDKVLAIKDDEASQDSQKSILGPSLLATALPIGMIKAKHPRHATSFQHFDVSKVEELLNAFFAKAAAYDEARSSSFEKLSKGLLERQLKANTHIQDAQVKESEEPSKI